jgi:hypothetical protein
MAASLIQQPVLAVLIFRYRQCLKDKPQLEQKQTHLVYKAWLSPVFAPSRVCTAHNLSAALP